jgi:hypothetical protein
MLCRVLIVLMAWTPFQLAHAGMIGTDVAISAASAQADRATVLGVINRADMTRELQALGVDPQMAIDRVAALTDEELRTLAGKMNAVPAGAASSGAGVVLLLLIILVVWLVFYKK